MGNHARSGRVYNPDHPAWALGLRRGLAGRYDRKKMFGKLHQRLQLDRSLGYVLAARVWHALSGPITIAIMIRAMTQGEQGLYYGLIQVVGIQALFELGLLNVVVSQSSHEHARRNRGPAEDASAAMARMSELSRASSRWFLGASLLFAVCAIILGWFTFIGGGSLAWQLPLLAMVPTAAIAIYLSPSLSLLEGAGFREEIYKARFYQIITGSLAVWLGLEFGLGLWVLPLSAGVQSAWSLYLTRIRFRTFFRELEEVRTPAVDYSWGRDVLPFQWRIAIISIVCHVATQFFTIIVIKFYSESEAAPLGMTLSITSACQMLAMAFAQTKFPVVAGLLGSSDREAAGTVWQKTAVNSTVLLCLALLCVMLVTLLLPQIGAIVERPLASRFLSVSQLAVLSAGCIVNHLIGLQGFYVLARRKNPLVLASVLGYGVVAIAVWIGGYGFSINGVLLAYSLALALVAFPIHTYAYLKLRAEA